jgi:hypothetical protein
VENRTRSSGADPGILIGLAKLRRVTGEGAGDGVNNLWIEALEFQWGREVKTG